MRGQWEAGRVLLYESGNDPDQILFWARFPIVLISLLLGWFVFKWAKELAGYLAGFIALLLYAFDPNILGHNHFVTTDLHLQFHAPVRAGTVTAKAFVERRDERNLTGTCEVFAADGTKVATFTSNFRILQREI